MYRSQLAAGAGAVLAVVLVTQPIFAQKAFLEEFKQIYPGLDKKVANCGMCHAAGKEKPGKKNLNPYGKELQSAPEAKDAMEKDGKHKYTPDELKAVTAGIKAIGTKKTNANGKTNDENIKAGVMPGGK